MKRRRVLFVRFSFVLLIVMLLTSVNFSDLHATNGDNLIGVGAISRSMGGVGVAAPRDAISAIFANPAAMCTGPYCPGSQTVFAGTYFSPAVKSRITFGGNTKTTESDMDVFIVPALGISTPITNRLRFGFGAYGVSGMGVDYRNKEIDLDGDSTNGYEGDIYTQIQIMKFAPNLAYMVTPNFSVGISLHVVYGSLDLGEGTSHGYTLGAQLGAIYKVGHLSFGLSYTTAEKIKHSRVYDFDGDMKKDALKLESPQNIAFGIAFEPDRRVLIEGNVKWYNWADADGYRDFDWKDQWVYALGLQYKTDSGLSVRVGYNYGKNPVKKHDDFNMMGYTEIQGKKTGNLGYEYLRIVGLPAIAEHHITFGLGYEFSKTFQGHIGFMHAFKNKIKESDSTGTYTFESELSEDSIEFALLWNF